MRMDSKMCLCATLCNEFIFLLSFLPKATTIECNKVILSISFGKLDGRCRRACVRPLNENFHKVLNFPSESGKSSFSSFFASFLVFVVE